MSRAWRESLTVVDIDTLLEVGTDLARPMKALLPATVDDDDDIVGYWNGDGSWNGDRDDPDALWVAVSTSIIEDDLPEGFVVVRSSLEPVVTIEKNMSSADGQPLAARGESSLPPLEAVFQFGPEPVKDWLADLDWPDREPWNSNFPDPTGESYLEFWQQQCPVYRSDLIAAVGGWHFPWPDGDWHDRLDDTLLLWTVADSEPWIEVWRRSGELIANARNT